MTIKRANNQESNQLSSEDDHLTELAFLRLGEILAEIAKSMEQGQHEGPLQEKKEKPSWENQHTDSPEQNAMPALRIDTMKEKTPAGRLGAKARREGRWCSL